MPTDRPMPLSREPDALATGIAQRLAGLHPRIELAPLPSNGMAQASAVLFLLSPNGGPPKRSHGLHDVVPDPAQSRSGEASPTDKNSHLSELNLVLNKRSTAVRQAGDLCCPGGGITPGLDRILAALLKLPRTPLTAWPQWTAWCHRRPDQAQRLALLFGTALREGFEEMRLNPLGVRFLGPLSVERLIVFKKEIYPFVGWISRQQRFYPNWEVDDIVYLPFRELLDPSNYACLHYRISSADTHVPKGSFGEMPCYIHRGVSGSDTEVLWGATYRITMTFLRLIFGFQPPPMEHLAVVKREFGDTYVNGKR